MSRRRDDLPAFLSPLKSQEAFAADLAELQRVLDYNPESGEFRWKIGAPGRRKNGRAGSLAATGYREICVHYCRFLEHRLALLLVTGRWPSEATDHIDGDRANNRFVNIRDVSQQVNSQNRRSASPTRNLCGFLGVETRVLNSSTTYIARISVLGVRHTLGRFSCPEEAHAVYVKAKRQLHEGCTL